MKIIFLMFLCVVISSCAVSGTEMQAECESQFREFPEIFQCTYENVASRNPRILQDARAKLYLLRGEQLAIEVLEKKITNLEAKILWQKLYVQIKTAKDFETALAIQSISKKLDAQRLNIPYQVPLNKSVNCVSNTIGSSLYTTCK
jgi:hypothetical protein